MANPNIPEPVVDGATVQIRNLVFTFDSDAEALMFVDAYGNATDVTEVAPSSEDEGTWGMYKDEKKRALDRMDGLRRGHGWDTA